MRCGQKIIFISRVMGEPYILLRTLDFLVLFHSCALRSFFGVISIQPRMDIIGPVTQG